MNEQQDAEFGDLRLQLPEAQGVEAERQDPSSLIIENPFDPDKIKISTEKKTIDLIIRRIRYGEIDLAPEFQRRARLWTNQRRSQLIESLLLKIPLPVFYVAADQKDEWAVVDGLQRLTTILDFMEGNFALDGLEYLAALEGRTFHDLDRAMKRRIEETELVINVIQPGTPDEVMINIFKRINTGGLPLTAQEIRNALHKGPVRAYLRRLVEAEDFQVATDYSVRDVRMDAQEMALRFLAFRNVGWDAYKVHGLDAFLNETMRRLNGMSDAERNHIGSDFFRVMRAAGAIFGNNAFRKPHRQTGGRNPISKPLFEAWSVNLAEQTDAEIELLIERAPVLTQGLKNLLLHDTEFEKSITYSTGNAKRVEKRFEEIKNLIEYVLYEETDND
jgi:hypothetical protein